MSFSLVLFVIPEKSPAIQMCCLFYIVYWSSDTPGGGILRPHTFDVKSNTVTV